MTQTMPTTTRSARATRVLLGAFLAAGLGAPLAAQQADAVSLSLADALARGLAAGEGVAIARAGVAGAEGELLQARSELFPRVGASAAYTRTLASEFEDVSLDFGEGGEGFGDLPFGQENRYDLGLQLQQTLWSGGRVRGTRDAARAALLGAGAGLDESQAEVAFDVTRAYFDAQLADRLVVVSEAVLAQAERALAQTSLRFDVGDTSEFDLLRARVATDTERPVVLRRRSDRDLAQLRLRQLLDLPLDAPLELTTPLVDFAAGPAPLAPPPEDGAAREAWLASLVAQRTPVRQAEADLLARRALLQVARSQRLPGLALTSDYGRVAYPGSGLPDGGDLRTNWTVGLGVRLPLLTGGRVKGEVATAAAAVEASEAQLQLVRELAWLDARQAFEELDTARAVWEASAGTVEQARRAFDIADLRYREGLSTQLELSDARLLLQQAESNRLLAARDLQLAEARIALLPALPLGMGSLAADASSAPAAPAGSGLATARLGGR